MANSSKQVVAVLGSRTGRERILKVTTRVMGASGESEDAAHDAVVQALSAAGSFRDQAQVTTWLHRVAVNAALMRLRKRSRSAKRVVEQDADALERAASHVANESPTPGALVEAQQEAARVRAEVDRLPALYRDVIRLLVFEEAPLDEAARALGLTPSAVRTRMGRARAQLKSRLVA